MNTNAIGNGLATISQENRVPETRMTSAQQVQDYVRRLCDNDVNRGEKRRWVNGMVDGNPPFSPLKMRKLGRADATNCNFGFARSYMESGSGGFYDLFSEAPGFLGVKTSYGTQEQREYYNAVMREEADRILSADDVWDYTMQQSQWDMVLHGCGPLVFEDGFAALPKAFHCGDLKVPEFTKSDTHYWEAACILANYYPPELFDWIRNSHEATVLGWRVPFTRRVIQNAMGLKRQNTIMPDWEFYQDELKTNSLSYSNDENKMVKAAHVFWKEFDGRVTHAIVEQDSTTTGNSAVEFMFQRIGRYESWKQVIHPMYFDRGNRGYHHSVTGLGVKMGKPLDYMNKLMCNLLDKARSPKILFRPTTTESAQKFQLAHFGDYAVLPGGFEWQQTGIAGLMNDGLAMTDAIHSVMRETLSGYRQGPMKQDGNPPTARQVMYDASLQSGLSKTTFNRYYKQLDLLYTEIFRRLCNLNSIDPRAVEFQERCRKRGVPDECFGRIEKVEAIRVVGQGSAFMRREAIAAIAAVAQALPEDGRELWLSDFIAAHGGQSAASRYNPPRKQNALATDQEAEAIQWVAAMKTGTPPAITASQDPVLYAATWLRAASQTLQNSANGGNPMAALQLLDLLGPAIVKQLARFSKDPSRAQIFNELQRQWKVVAEQTDQLRQMLGDMQQAAADQAQKTQAAMSDEQLAQTSLAADIRRKDIKTAAQLQQSARKHQLQTAQKLQDMALKDASTAADIRLNRLKAGGDLRPPTESE